MLDVITIGETMILLEPVEEGPLKYVTTFKKKFGGAESNVAIGLARLGTKVGWISGVNYDSLGEYLITSIRGEGVDTSTVVEKNNSENALYIKERTTLKTNHVYYYRQGAAASHLTFEDLDLDYLKNTKMIHLTGITPFLSPTCLDLCQKVIAFAKQHQITVSFDPNIRKKLMQNVPDAKNILLNLCLQADILLPGLDEAMYLTGLETPEDILAFFQSKGVKKVILKNGENGSYYVDESNVIGKINSFPVEMIADPIGAGDGFAAGVLNGLINDLSLADAVTQGSIIGSLVVQVKGDVEGLPSMNQLKNFQTGRTDVVR